MLYSSTKYTLFKIVYGSDVILSVEINTSTWRQEHFDDEGNPNN